jgi:hypothetical protein
MKTLNGKGTCNSNTCGLYGSCQFVNEVNRYWRIYLFKLKFSVICVCTNDDYRGEYCEKHIPTTSLGDWWIAYRTIMILLYLSIFFLSSIQIAVRLRIHGRATHFNVAMFMYLLLLVWSSSRILYYILPAYTWTSSGDRPKRKFFTWLDFFGGDLMLTCYSALIVSW